MVTMNLDLIAQMSCNPAVGGIAKGHLVREIDALGGVMGEVTDAVGIQFRLLNTSRGPAVWSPRAQCDKKQYRLRMREFWKKSRISASSKPRSLNCRFRDGPRFEASSCGTAGILRADAVVVTTGTFLNGLAHVGEQKFSCGRSGEAPSNLLGRPTSNAGP